MEKCKFCQAELEEGNAVCPVCGRNNDEEEAAIPVTDPENGATEKTASPKAAGEKVEEVSAPEEEPAPMPQTPEEKEAGKGAEEAPIVGKPGVQATPGKIALAVAGIVVLLAVLVTLVVYGIGGSKKESGETVPSEKAASAVTEIPETIPETTPATIPADGNPDDVTCKGSYTVTDAEALASRDTVVATVDGKELTNGVLQVYYWQQVQSFLSNYGAYASYFGLDYRKPLDTQLTGEDGMTWQQKFLMDSLTSWHQMQAVGLEAEKAGASISPEDQANLDGLQASLEENAAQYSMTLEELLCNNFGPGAKLEDFRQNQTDWYLAAPYYNGECSKLAPTEQELKDFFALHEKEYESQDITKDGVLVDVRHILIMPEGGTTDENGNTVYSDEEWQACQEKAEELLNTWQSGEKTEESFGALANEHSSDGGSNTNGGLYENVVPGQMVEEFNDWCFDESRAAGDTGLVKTTFGYHIMYFSDSRPQWRYYSEQDWLTEHSRAIMEDMVNSHPIQVSYDKIALGLAPLH